MVEGTVLDEIQDVANTKEVVTPDQLLAKYVVIERKRLGSDPYSPAYWIIATKRQRLLNKMMDAYRETGMDEEEIREMVHANVNHDITIDGYPVRDCHQFQKQGIYLLLEAGSSGIVGDKSYEKNEDILPKEEIERLRDLAPQKGYLLHNYHNGSMHDAKWWTGIKLGDFKMDPQGVVDTVRRIEEDLALPKKETPFPVT